MTRKLDATDFYCGAGGTSCGAESTGGVTVTDAINHWAVAVKTHSANHPHTRHINSRIDLINPSEVRRMDLMLASPECTYFSRARGSKPVSDQQRSGAWDLMKWINYHHPSWIVVENVREFEQWGPTRNGVPLKSKRGQLFEAWVRAIQAEGYRVDWRVLNAADFGAATSRQRLFVMARKGNRNPVWPTATHCENAGGELPGFGMPRWRAAAEVIDWSIPCPSIFSRIRPLADKTLLRIEAGLRRFVGPFVVKLRNNMTADAVGDPLGTLTAGGGHNALAVPYILPNEGYFRGNVARDIGRPVPAVVAGRGAGAVVMPFISAYHNGNDGSRRNYSPESGIPVLDTSNRYALVLPYLFDVNHGATAGDNGRSHSIDDPLRVATQKRGQAMAVPFLSTYYGNGGCSRVDCPIPTLTTKDRISLSVCELCGLRFPSVDSPSAAMQKLLATMRELGVSDIGFRMLVNSELALAQGFPESYIFHGNKGDVTRQIGNSVSPPNAKSIIEAILAV